MASVSFDDIAKVYPDGTRAASGFDVEIADGEFRVLVGQSGSGKTTAVRMVAGLEEISEGVVLIGALERPTRRADACTLDAAGHGRDSSQAADVPEHRHHRAGDLRLADHPAGVFFAFQRYVVQGLLAGSVSWVRAGMHRQAPS